MESSASLIGSPMNDDVESVTSRFTLNLGGSSNQSTPSFLVGFSNPPSPYAQVSVGLAYPNSNQSSPRPMDEYAMMNQDLVSSALPSPSSVYGGHTIHGPDLGNLALFEDKSDMSVQVDLVDGNQKKDENGMEVDEGNVDVRHGTDDDDVLSGIDEDDAIITPKPAIVKPNHQRYAIKHKPNYQGYAIKHNPKPKKEEEDDEEEDLISCNCKGIVGFIQTKMKTKKCKDVVLIAWEDQCAKFSNGRYVQTKKGSNLMQAAVTQEDIGVMMKDLKSPMVKKINYLIKTNPDLAPEMKLFAKRNKLEGVECESESDEEDGNDEEGDDEEDDEEDDEDDQFLKHGRIKHFLKLGFDITRPKDLLVLVQFKPTCSYEMAEGVFKYAHMKRGGCVVYWSEVWMPVSKLDGNEELKRFLNREK